LQAPDGWIAVVGLPWLGEGERGERQKGEDAVSGAASGGRQAVGYEKHTVFSPVRGQAHLLCVMRIECLHLN